MITFPHVVIVGDKNNSATTKQYQFWVDGVQDNPSAIASTAKILEVGAFKHMIDYPTPPNGATMSQTEFYKKSAPIYLNDIVSVKYDAAVMPSLQKSTIDFGSSLTVGAEYVIRIVYKDMVGHPGQFTHTYRQVMNTDADTLATDFVSLINSDPKSRVKATASYDTLTLEAKPINWRPGIEEYNEFEYVNMFVAFYEDSLQQAGSINTPAGAVVEQYVVSPDPGIGFWKKVRDDERRAWGYDGIYHPVHKPPLMPDLIANGSEVGCYDRLSIQSMVPYQSPDNSYKKKTDVRFTFYAPKLDLNGTAVTAADYSKATLVMTNLKTYFGV